MPYSDIYWRKLDSEKQEELLKDFLGDKYPISNGPIKDAMTEKAEEDYKKYVESHGGGSNSIAVENLDVKISALTDLMQKGIITPEELVRLIQALNGNTNNSGDQGPLMSPAEFAYSKYIDERVRKHFKSPSSVQYPPFDGDMVKQGTLTIDGKIVNTKYIETYIDAPNSYGTMLRAEIVILFDNDFNMLHWAEHVYLGALLGKSKDWTMIE